jgi:hypothetical protein
MATVSRIQIEGGSVLAQDLKYETIKEDWNVYKLEDGTIFKAKLAATKISRGLSEDGKSIFYSSNGEPLYNIRYTVIVSPEVSEKLLRKQ